MLCKLLLWFSGVQQVPAVVSSSGVLGIEAQVAAAVGGGLGGGGVDWEISGQGHFS